MLYEQFNHLMHTFRTSSVVKRALIAALVVAPAILAGCTPSHPQSTFGASGPVAEDQKNIFLLIFWVAMAVFVIVESALVYSIVRFRRRRRGEQPPEQLHGNTRLELAWTAAPVIILAIIAIPTVTLIFDQSRGPVEGKTAENALDIAVYGHQWWWEVEYVGKDVNTSNEIVIPVGRPIRLELTSEDVIHSFWVPKLSGKKDMIPNNTNVLFIQADEPGLLFGQCAEFCGEAHANMRFRVRAMVPADFETWLESMRRPSEPPEPGSDAAQGQQLFASNCSTCHSTRTYDVKVARNERERQTQQQRAFEADPENARIIAAPNLTHFATRLTMAAGIVDLNRGSLERWIRDPDDIKPGNRMKDIAAVYGEDRIQLSDQEVSQIASYLLSLKPTEKEAVAEAAPSGAGDPVAHGEQLFTQQGCVACHSTGDDTIVGPGLAGLKARASDRVAGMSLEEYVHQSIVDPNAHVVEGFNPVMPPNFGDIMSEGEIDDLVAYLLSLE